MRINEHIALTTPQILLVPYSAHHVPTYHTWMQDPDLQQATASEPLSLAEEYAMQHSWRTDKDKLTFIVCLPPTDALSQIIVAEKDDAPDRMVGDVNLFVVEDDNVDGEQGSGETVLVGEVEIMIARRDLQGRGLGRATLLVFLEYVVRNLEGLLDEYMQGSQGVGGEKCRLDHLRVRIGSENEKSLKLFESLGFRKIKEEPNFFGELELRLAVNRGSMEHLASCKGFEIARVLPYQ